MIGDDQKFIEIPPHITLPGPQSAPSGYLAHGFIEAMRLRMLEGVDTHPNDPWLTTGVPMCKGGEGTLALMSCVGRHWDKVLNRYPNDTESNRDHYLAIALRAMQAWWIDREVSLGHLDARYDDLCAERKR